MYLTKIQSLDDERMIVKGKGKNNYAYGNLKILNLQTKTNNPFLLENYIYHDFAVAQDK